MISLPLPAFAEDYLIASQDVLKITVFEYPDLTTEARVSEDGKITFPLLGEIDAKNLTTRQVEKSIAENLISGNIVNNPQVSVFIQQYRGRKITIIGEVIKPGQFEISGPTTILDIIPMALGLSQNAGYLITVFRKDPASGVKESTTKINVDVDRLLNGGDLSQNIDLQNGDVVYVPKAIFYIYGEVNRPGAYRLEKGITIKKAIALAGGLTPKGSENRIEVTRKQCEIKTSKITDIGSYVRMRVEQKQQNVCPPQSAEISSYVGIDDVIMIKKSIF